MLRGETRPALGKAKKLAGLLNGDVYVEVMIFLPDDVFGGLVVHAVLDVFHGEDGGQARWMGKLINRGIRSGE